MPIQPGTFFAALLIVVSLATNIVYFADFRESVLAGHDNAAASVSAEKVAEPEEIQIEPLPMPPQAAVQTAEPLPEEAAQRIENSREKKSGSRVNLPIPMTNEPFLQPSAVQPLTKDSDTETKPPEPVAAPPVTVTQVTAPMAGIPKAERAEPAEAIANQFKPVMRQPQAEMPVAIAIPQQVTVPQVAVPKAEPPKKYSSDAVWTSVDSALESW